MEKQNKIKVMFKKAHPVGFYEGQIVEMALITAVRLQKEGYCEKATQEQIDNFQVAPKVQAPIQVDTTIAKECEDCKGKKKKGKECKECEKKKESIEPIQTEIEETDLPENND
jgi:methionyl-tRNA synthetase